MKLFIMLYRAVLTFESVDKTQSVNIQIKALEQYFHLMLLVKFGNFVSCFDLGHPLE